MEFFQVTGDRRRPWINLDTIQMIVPRKNGFAIHLRDGHPVEVTAPADVERLAALLGDVRNGREMDGEPTVH
jgi:hypothetical protein